MELAKPAFDTMPVEKKTFSKNEEKSAKSFDSSVLKEANWINFRGFFLRLFCLNEAVCCYISIVFESKEQTRPRGKQWLAATQRESEENQGHSVKFSVIVKIRCFASHASAISKFTFSRRSFCQKANRRKCRQKVNLLEIFRHEIDCARPITQFHFFHCFVVLVFLRCFRFQSYVNALCGRIFESLLVFVLWLGLFFATFHLKLISIRNYTILMVRNEFDFRCIIAAHYPSSLALLYLRFFFFIWIRNFTELNRKMQKNIQIDVIWCYSFVIKLHFDMVDLSRERERWIYFRDDFMLDGEQTKQNKPPPHSSCALALASTFIDHAFTHSWTI